MTVYGREDPVISPVWVNCLTLEKLIVLNSEMMCEVSFQIPREMVKAVASPVNKGENAGKTTV